MKNLKQYLCISSILSAISIILSAVNYDGSISSEFAYQSAPFYLTLIIPVILSVIALIIGCMAWGATLEKRYTQEQSSDMKGGV